MALSETLESCAEYEAKYGEFETFSMGDAKSPGAIITALRNLHRHKAPIIESAKKYAPDADYKGAYQAISTVMRRLQLFGDAVGAIRRCLRRIYIRYHRDANV